MPPLFIILYIAASALVGFLGRKRAIGFAGMFILAVFLTPLVMSVVLLVSAPKSQDSTG